MPPRPRNRHEGRAVHQICREPGDRRPSGESSLRDHHKLGPPRAYEPCRQRRDVQPLPPAHVLHSRDDPSAGDPVPEVMGGEQ